MGLRRSQVLSFLREGGYSVVFLQETHTDPAAEASWRLEWGDGAYFSHFSVCAAGVATLFSPDLRPEVLGVAEAVPGRLLHLRVRVEGLVVNLVNVYAPTSAPERLHFYQQASAFLGSLDPRECLVLGGDFNTTLEERDRSGTEQCPAAADVLREIVDRHSLVDVWRDHHPDDVSTFTFVRVEAHRSCHSRLDRIYLSRFHLSRAHSSSVRPAPFSDHHLATVTASLCAERPGPAYWHFNNSLLEDAGFVASFREFWLAWRGQRRAFSSVRRWWDLGKVRARLFCRDYTRGASRRRDAAIGQLEREVLELERRLAVNPEDPSLCGACREKREELRALEDHRARGAFVRSRIHLLREMDRGSRFFYALEKRRGAKKHVTCLLAEDGTPLTDPAEMCQRARAFYATLFSPDPTDPNACRVLWDGLPTVSTGDRDRLELPLTLAKFSEALRHMPTNKSPGLDGLTVEFYRVFWDVLGPDLVTVWAEALQSGVLPLSCRRAVLALLPKRGDLRDLRNWRPVSLLSTDYKIVAKAISMRLGSVLADVVHPDQTYTVPGRTIFDNLSLVRDLLELGCRDGLSFALLSLDQEKAFDRMDHGYLLGTLRAFGFGPLFVGFLQVLYASAECLVRLNWTLTEPVSFGRGVRQGCPLSGQLYTLAIEPFLCLLRKRLTGLVLRELGLRLVLSAYADDVLLVVQDPGDLAR
uniref:Reverse transcriptase domain-containing protein n=1 Tax=Gopherus agassizii TaxID=38772 RepID=A0A452HFR9_9SAUR